MNLVFFTERNVATNFNRIFYYVELLEVVPSSVLPTEDSKTTFSNVWTPSKRCRRHNCSPLSLGRCTVIYVIHICIAMHFIQQHCVFRILPTGYKLIFVTNSPALIYITFDAVGTHQRPSEKEMLSRKQIFIGSVVTFPI